MLLLLLACGRPDCAIGDVWDDDERACVAAEQEVLEDPNGGWRSDDAIVPIASGATWQWQLTGAIDTTVEVEVYDLDLFHLTNAVRDTLHADDRMLLCYFSAGTYEPWRADADDFPESAIGDPLPDWPDERWVDIRSEAIRDVMRARMDWAVEWGCHGVEPDNVTAANEDSGFDLTTNDQIDFNRFLADEAHARGLSVGLKNYTEEASVLEPDFDWTLNEECVAWSECFTLDPFVEANKAVLHTEYVDDWADAPQLKQEICPVRDGFSTLIKTWDLGAEYLPCG